MSYCSYCASLPADNLHKIYHDNHYGFDIDSDDELFGRLILEINQAGLSWNTILNKQKSLIIYIIRHLSIFFRHINSNNRFHNRLTIWHQQGF